MWPFLTLIHLTPTLDVTQYHPLFITQIPIQLLIKDMPYHLFWVFLFSCGLWSNANHQNLGSKVWLTWKAKKRICYFIDKNWQSKDILKQSYFIMMHCTNILRVIVSKRFVATDAFAINGLFYVVAKIFHCSYSVKEIYLQLFNDSSQATIMVFCCHLLKMQDFLANHLPNFVGY